MKGFKLTPREIQELKIAHKLLKDKKLADRIKAVYLLGIGRTQEDVCEVLMLDERTLRHYVKRYSENGIQGLVSNHYLGWQGKLSAEEEDELDKHLQEVLYLNAKEVANYIAKEFNQRYGIRGVTELLKRLGYVYKKPKIVPGKANLEKQKKFIKAYEKLKAKLNSTAKVLFMDGTHPQHNTVAAYGWIKKGQTKEVRNNTGRQRLNINGALDIATGKVTVTFEEALNALTVLTLFKKLCKVYKRAGRLYIICDNAGYYKAESVQVALKNLDIELVFLPPYSPNLNLLERVWRFFRKKVLYNQYYEKFADFKDATETFFYGGIKKYRAELKLLLTENFQIIGQQP